MNGSDSITSLADAGTSAHDSEEMLLEKARGALSNCNWIVGECAAKWTEKYARGRTDADFGNLISLSADQVFQRRRVWQTFYDVRDSYAGLKWSHFYVALNWDDASECLQWAVDNEATIAEMRAWRRSIHGEDLTVDPDPYALQALDYDNALVRGAGEERGRSESDSDVPFDVNVSGEYASASASEATPYAPFRKDARGEVQGYESGPETEETRVKGGAEDASPARVIKRVVGGLKKMRQLLEALSEDDFAALTPDVQNQLWDAYEELGHEIKRQV